ncbi:MAG: hypothetical protein ACHQSE_07535 [Gemmatimonadales bacterium]
MFAIRASVPEAHREIEREADWLPEEPAPAPEPEAPMSIMPE